jgi:hypothetical protein
VNRQVADNDHFVDRIFGVAIASQMEPQASDQGHWPNGLDHEIVSPNLQAQDFVHFLTASCQNQYGPLIQGAYLAADSKPIEAWQINVKYHGVRLMGQDTIDCSPAMPLNFDAKIILLQKHAHDPGKLRIIFDQKNRFHTGLAAFSGPQIHSSNARLFRCQAQI